MSSNLPNQPEIFTPWYMTRKQLLLVTGLSRNTIDRLERLGQFPKRIELSGRKVGWDLQEVTSWRFERERQRDRPCR